MTQESAKKPIILSAGEIGSYTVCPESWRLRVIERRRVEALPASSEGRKLHRLSVQKYDQASHLLTKVKILLALLGTAIVLYFLKGL
ncbi:MAG: hypothetical protein DCC75_10590 [Proteobacteria bacterium]|nr:MAG: hypothetical protein DCC75_10590 [Pseudomonadota bacterium]